MTTLMPLTIPWSHNSEAPPNRASERRSSTITGSRARRARPAGESAVRTELGMAHESLPPPRARPQQQRRTIGEEFQDVAVLRLEVPGDEGGGLVHEGSQVEPGDALLAQLGHGRLLAHSGLQHSSGASARDDLLMGRVERRHDLDARRCESPRLVRMRHVLRVERPARRRRSWPRSSPPAYRPRGRE